MRKKFRKVLLQAASRKQAEDWRLKTDD